MVRIIWLQIKKLEFYLPLMNFLQIPDLLSLGTHSAQLLSFSKATIPLSFLSQFPIFSQRAHSAHILPLSRTPIEIFAKLAKLQSKSFLSHSFFWELKERWFFFSFFLIFSEFISFDCGLFWWWRSTSNTKLLKLSREKVKYVRNQVFKFLALLS